MLGLTKPKHFIPIHGEFRMQVQHGRLAIETGVEPENVFIIENGTPIELYADGSARRGTPVTAGYVFVDGLSVGEVGEIVLRDRRSLANDGMFMIVVTVDKQTGSVVGRPGDRHARLRPPQRARPAHGRGRRARHHGDRHARRPHQRDRPAQDARSRTASRATSTSRPSADRWSSRSWSRSELGDEHDGRARPGPARTEPAASRAPRRRRSAGFTSRFTPGGRPLDRGHGDDGPGGDHAHRPDPPRRGRPDRLVARLDRAVVRDRPLAAAVPAAGRRLVDRRADPGKKPGSGWGMTLGGLAIAYIAALGAFEVLAVGDLRTSAAAAASVASWRRRWSRCSPDRVPSSCCWRSPARADARVQPPAARARRAVHRRGSLGRLHDRGLAAAGAGGPPGRRRNGCGDQRDGQGHDGDHEAAGRDPGPRPLDDAARSILDEPAPRTGQPPVSQTVWTGADGRRQCAGGSMRPALGVGRGALGDRPGGRRPDGPRVAERDRLDPAGHRPARAERGRTGERQRRPRVEQAAHRGEAAELLDPGQGRGGQLGPGRDPVRGPPGAPRQGVAHRGAGRRPGDGPRRPLDPDRGADPGQGRRRHRDPQLGQRGRRLQAARRREPDARLDEPADVRARAATSRARPTPSTWPRCRTCSSPAPPARARACASTRSSRAC